jgi:hypothetical protein
MSDNLLLVLNNFIFRHCVFLQLCKHYTMRSVTEREAKRPNVALFLPHCMVDYNRRLYQEHQDEGYYKGPP